MQDYYDILGVSRSADQKAIEKAYRKMAAKCHPDLNQGSEESKQKFQDVGTAYDVLSDASKRAIYDGNPTSPVQTFGAASRYRGIFDIPLDELTRQDLTESWKGEEAAVHERVVDICHHRPDLIEALTSIGIRDETQNVDTHLFNVILQVAPNRFNLENAIMLAFYVNVFEEKGKIEELGRCKRSYEELMRVRPDLDDILSPAPSLSDEELKKHEDSIDMWSNNHLHDIRKRRAAEQGQEYLNPQEREIRANSTKGEDGLTNVQRKILKRALEREAAKKPKRKPEDDGLNRERSISDDFDAQRLTAYQRKIIERAERRHQENKPERDRDFGMER